MKTISPSRTSDWVTGTVAGGFVHKTSGFAGCVNETFAVTASLTGAATKTTTGGTGTFTGELTHRRVVIFGACRIYAAAITGLVTFHY